MPEDINSALSKIDSEYTNHPENINSALQQIDSDYNKYPDLLVPTLEKYAVPVLKALIEPGIQSARGWQAIAETLKPGGGLQSATAGLQAGKTYGQETAKMLVPEVPESPYRDVARETLAQGLNMGLDPLTLAGTKLGTLGTKGAEAMNPLKFVPGKLGKFTATPETALGTNIVSTVDNAFSEAAKGASDTLESVKPVLSRFKQGDLRLPQVGLALDGKLKPEMLDSDSVAVYTKIKETYKNLGKVFNVPQKRMLKDYLPHIWVSSDKNMNVMDEELLSIIQKKMGKNILAPQDIDVFFKHARKGDYAISLDPVKTLEIYTRSGYKQLAIQKSVKEAQGMINKLPEQWQRDYGTKWLKVLSGETMKDAALKSAKLFQADKNLSLSIYNDLLGFAFKSTFLTNLTQTINTVAKEGLVNTIGGAGWYAGKMLSKAGRQELRNSGVYQDYTHMLELEAKVFENLPQKVSNMLMSPLTISEHINRGIARQTGIISSLRATRGSGLTKAQRYVIAQAEGKRLSDVAQFQYGKIHDNPYIRENLSMVMRQFSSYPLKQANFLYNLAKDDPSRIVPFLALSGSVVAAKKGYGFEETFSDPAKVMQILEQTAMGSVFPSSLAKLSPSALKDISASVDSIVRGSYKADTAAKQEELWMKVLDGAAKVASAGVASKTGFLPMPLKANPTQILRGKQHWAEAIPVRGVREWLVPPKE